MSKGLRVNAMDKNLKDHLMSYMVGNLSCQGVSEIVTEYLEGAMPWSTRIRFHMHLGLCSACRNYLQQMKYTVQTLGKIPAEPISPQVRDALLKRFKDWKKQ
ncbi:MAG: zf-HC2 domain-containing protein [Nitrospirales bacterium]